MPILTIDEAIMYCEKIAAEKCDLCGDEHRQLGEWLKDYKILKAEAESKSKEIKISSNHRYAGLGGSLQKIIDSAKQTKF